MRLDTFLAEQNVSYESLPHPPAYTAQKLAKYLHVSGSRVAKCVLLRVAEKFLLAVLPATHRVDTDQLSHDQGDRVRLADDSEIAQVFHDCEWGVVPPFGALYGLQTILDESLAPDTLLVFEGQTHVEAIRLRCGDFERLERPRRFSFARH